VPTTREQALDTRDLTRGPIAASTFDRARAEKYPPVETIRALNALREELPALKSKELRRLSSDREDVLALVRLGERSLVGLSNLSGEARTVRIPRAELEASLGSLPENGRLADLFGSKISGRSRHIPFALEGETVAIQLAPYEHVLM
jgi:hypothetical protein